MEKPKRKYTKRATSAPREKRKYTKRAQAAQPFTCEIHGRGIDIDIKLDGLNDLDKLTSALTNAITKVTVTKVTPPPPARPLMPLTEAAAISFMAALNDEELQIVFDVSADEKLRRNPGANDEAQPA